MRFYYFAASSIWETYPAQVLIMGLDEFCNCCAWLWLPEPEFAAGCASGPAGGAAGAGAGASPKLLKSTLPNGFGLEVTADAVLPKGFELNAFLLDEAVDRTGAAVCRAG